MFNVLDLNSYHWLVQFSEVEIRTLAWDIGWGGGLVLICTLSNCSVALGECTRMSQNGIITLRTNKVTAKFIHPLSIRDAHPK